MFNQKKTVKELPDKYKEGFKFTYKDIKKCVMKKESGEDSDSCKKLWKDLGVEEAG